MLVIVASLGLFFFNIFLLFPVLPLFLLSLFFPVFVFVSVFHVRSFMQMSTIYVKCSVFKCKRRMLKNRKEAQRPWVELMMPFSKG